MANMSYVRFENTLPDLRDCYDHLFDLDLSESEQKARRRLIRLIHEIVVDLKDSDQWVEE